MRASVDAGLVDATITCGQAFGGDYEAVNLHSGLLAARFVAGAQIAIIAIGPGVVGTSTSFGHGGVAQGEAVNAVAALHGTPIPVLRLSFADDRNRHRVVSHHTLCALTRVALASALIAVPQLPKSQAVQVEALLAEQGVWKIHKRAPVVHVAAEPDLRGVEVTTMGRGPSDDPAFFSAAYAAGAAACAAEAGRAEIT
jgi:hypothetical protein